MTDVDEDEFSVRFTGAIFLVALDSLAVPSGKGGGRIDDLRAVAKLDALDLEAHLGPFVPNLDAAFCSDDGGVSEGRVLIELALRADDKPIVQPVGFDKRSERRLFWLLSALTLGISGAADGRWWRAG